MTCFNSSRSFLLPHLYLPYFILHIFFFLFHYASAYPSSTDLCWYYVCTFVAYTHTDTHLVTYNIQAWIINACIHIPTMKNANGVHCLSEDPYMGGPINSSSSRQLLQIYIIHIELHPQLIITTFIYIFLYLKFVYIY